MRKVILAGIVAVVLLALGGTVAYVLLFRPPAPPAAQPAAPETATVTRTDLTASVTLVGSLGYGPPTTFTGRKNGTVTWLPAVGTVVDRGKRLYSVDAKPVPLFLGDTPLYRTIEASAPPGPDIKEVNANLRALGFRSAPKGDAYTEGTAAALREWQRRNGLDQTGTVAAGDVAVLPASVRVESVKVTPGAQATAELLGLTSTTKLVTATADPAKVDTKLFKPDGTVELTLPGDRKAAGKIATVGAPGDASGGGSETDQEANGPGRDSPGTVLTITIADQGTVSDVDSGAVEITMTTESRKGVLAVPVGALVAVQGGRYALQEADGGTSTLIAVRTGKFADGLVEVSGEGVVEGLKVVTVS